MRRLQLAAALAAALALAPTLAPAATDVPYTQAAFEAAQQAGAPILVWVHASWCPTCAKQAPTLATLEAEPRYAGLKVFVVDFDSQKDAVRAFGVRMQSTLIAFHGNAETARSTGETDPAAIADLLAKTAG